MTCFSVSGNIQIRAKKETISVAKSYGSVLHASFCVIFDTPFRNTQVKFFVLQLFSAELGRLKKVGAEKQKKT